MNVKFWVGGNRGDWAVPANWSTTGSPTANDIVLIQNGVATATNLDALSETVWLNCNIYQQAGLTLVNTDLGPTSNVLTMGTTGIAAINLSNSNLYGNIFAGGGSSSITVAVGTTSVNLGSITVAGSAPYTTETFIANGDFQNAGLIDAGRNGTFNLVYATGDTPQYVVNLGTIRADTGGQFGVSTISGTIINAGHIDAKGGSVIVDGSMQQTPEGVITVSKNGSLTLTGETDGGTIQIESGQLQFGSAEFAPGPRGGNEFHSTLDFTGKTGDIFFGVDTVYDVYDTTSHDLTVTAPFKGGVATIATIHLGSAAAYTQSDFTVIGGTVEYNAHAVG